MKKIISRTVLLMGAVAWFGLTSTVMAAVTLPTMESFDSVGLPANWSEFDGASSRGSYNVEGTYGRTLPALSSVALSVNPGPAYSNVWIQVFAKAQPSASSPDVSGNAGAFYVDNDGNVKYCDSTGWKTATMTPALITNTWIGFVVHADYGSQTWDLFCNRGASWDGTNNIFERVVSGASFITTIPYLTTVKVATGKASAVDAVAVSPSARNVPEDTASCNKVLVMKYPTTSGILTLPVWVAEYTPPNNTMANAVGLHIASGLVAGEGNDSIDIFDAIANSGYGAINTMYVLNNGTWDEVNSPAPLSVPVYPATAITLTRGTPANTCGFFDYSSAGAYVEAGNISTDSGLANTAVPVPLSGGWGPFAATLKGVNEMSWHGDNSETLQQLGTKLKNASPSALANGDRVYLLVGSIFIELTWKASENQWYQQANVSGYNSMKVSGVRFWLARQGSEVTSDVNLQ